MCCFFRQEDLASWFLKQTKNIRRVRVVVLVLGVAMKIINTYRHRITPYVLPPILILATMKNTI